MNSNSFLTAAYVVTWVIHIGYILHLGSRAKRVERDLKELRLNEPPSTTLRKSDGDR